MVDSDEHLEELAGLVASDDPAEVARAHEQALARMGQDPRVRRIAAIAYDRLRALLGREQKFGTVAVLDGGQRVLWPVDRATTDSERAKWGLESLTSLRTGVRTAPLVSKASLRRLLRERRQSVTKAQSEPWSQQIAQLAVTPVAERVRGGVVVAAYWPQPGEADPRPLARLLAEPGGVRLALPVVDGECMTFREWRDDVSLEPVGFGTLGPPVDAAEVEPAVVLTPLLGFDAGGARLGQGKGYYDRKLAQLSSPFVVGIAFANQELPAVPTEAHDRRLDLLVTERQARAFSD